MNDGEMITPIYAVQLISEYVLDCGLFVEPQAEQLEDKETSEDTLTRLQNGLFATGRFTIDKCIELSEGLITYLNEQWMSPSEQPEVTDEEIKNAAYEYYTSSEYYTLQAEVHFGNGAKAMRDGKISKLQKK
jgi:hypothetical protein